MVGEDGATDEPVGTTGDCFDDDVVSFAGDGVETEHDTADSGGDLTLDEDRYRTSMAIGVARASLELTRELLEDAGVVIDYDRPAMNQSAAAATFLQLEADWEAANLLTLQAAWMADNRKAITVAAIVNRHHVAAAVTIPRAMIRRIDRLEAM